MNMNRKLEKKLIKHLNNANKENLEHGLTWYNEAHKFALMVSKSTNTNLNKVIGIMSALSPRNKWAKNKIDLVNLLNNPSMDTTVSTFNSNKLKALKILDSNGSDAEILKILNGKKVTNFYHNIRYPNTSDSVTIDVWAFRSLDLKPSDKNYKLAEQIYKNLANELKIAPHKLQAIIWGVVRGNAL